MITKSKIFNAERALKFDEFEYFHMAVKPPKFEKKKFRPVRHIWRILRVFQIFDRSRDELYA